MLEYSREFIELAMRLNYTTAAEQLHLSTSALSRHIADLESELGFPLFNRTPLSLTQAGQYYLESISAIIDELDEVVAHGRKISEHLSKPFSVYMLPSRSPFANVVYEVSAGLRRNHAGLSTDICVDDRLLTTEEALLNGKADIGVVFAGSIVDKGAIAVEPFAEASVCVYVRNTSPLASKGAVVLQDLCDFFHPKTTNRQSLTATDSIRDLFASVGISLKLRLRNFPDRAGFFPTLKHDEFLVEFADDDEVLRVNPDLVRIEFAGGLRRPVFLAHRRDCDNPLVGEFIESCQQLARERGFAPAS